MLRNANETVLSSQESGIKNPARRKFLATIAKVAVTAPALVVANEVGQFVNDESLEIKMAGVSHIKIHPEFGDHVTYPEEITSQNAILSGELSMKVLDAVQARLAELHANNKTANDDLLHPPGEIIFSWHNILQAFTGVGTGGQKSLGDSVALMLALERGQTLIAADTTTRKDENFLLDSWSKSQTVVELAEIAAGLNLSEKIGRHLYKMRNKTQQIPRKMERRNFLKLFGIGVGSATVAVASGQTLLEGHFPRTKSNLIAQESRLLLDKIVGQVTGILSGEEAQLFGEIFVHQRTLNMLRNTEIADRILDSNIDQIATSTTRELPLYLRAGIGHSDMILYAQESTEQQDGRIRTHVQKVIEIYVNQLLSAEGDAEDVLARFSYITMLGFGIPAAYGKAREVFESFSLPDNLPKSAAAIFFDTLVQYIEKTDEKKQPHALMLLDRLINVYEDIYIAGNYKEKKIAPSFPNSLHAIGLIPETKTFAEATDHVQIFPQFRGLSAQQIFDNYRYDQYATQDQKFVAIPYGYSTRGGVPRIVFIEVDLDEDGGLSGGIGFVWYNRQTQQEEIKYTDPGLSDLKLRQS